MPEEQPFTLYEFHSLVAVMSMIAMIGLVPPLVMSVVFADWVYFFSRGFVFLELAVLFVSVRAKMDTTR